MLTPGQVALLSVVPTTTRRMKVWNGSAWQTGSLKVWNGSAWQTGSLKVWNGSAWV